MHGIMHTFIFFLLDEANCSIFYVLHNCCEHVDIISYHDQQSKTIISFFQGKQTQNILKHPTATTHDKEI